LAHRKRLEEELLSKINDYDSKMQQLADEIEATTANYALEQQQFEQLKVYHKISMSTSFIYVAPIALQTRSPGEV
jgi:hypothetical protein